MDKAYCYIRMSTDKQSQGDSFRRQQEKAEELCRGHGLEIDIELQLTDAGYSVYNGEGASGRFP